MKPPLSRFVHGFGLMPTGFRLILKPGIKRFVLIPLLINIIVFSTALWFGYQSLGVLVAAVTGWLPSWLDWLATVIWTLAAVIVIILIYFTFTLLANLIAAPFNSLLAAAAENILLGKKADQHSSLSSLTGIAARTMWSEIRKLLYQLKWLIGLVIISLIPGLNLLSPFAWFYFAAWMLAINYVDYPMGNHDLYFRDVKKQLKGDRMTALGLGSAILLLTLIPGVNFFAMPVGVISGTAYFVQARNTADNEE